MAMQPLPPNLDRENLTQKLLSDAAQLLSNITEGLEPTAAALIYQNLNDGAHLKLEIEMFPEPALRAVISSPDAARSYTLFATQVDNAIKTKH